jgi:hypothetical protein
MSLYWGTSSARWSSYCRKTVDSFCGFWTRLLQNSTSLLDVWDPKGPSVWQGYTLDCQRYARHVCRASLVVNWVLHPQFDSACNGISSAAYMRLYAGLACPMHCQGLSFGMLWGCPPSAGTASACRVALAQITPLPYDDWLHVRHLS